jgi:hypothetical protein
MKKYIITTLLILFTLYSWSQDQNLFICETEQMPEDKSTPSIDLFDYASEPIKTIRVNLIFVRRDDGTGGFQQNNPAHTTYINDKKSNANQIMSNISSNYDPTCYNGSMGVWGDSKIRFLFNEIYVNSTEVWKGMYSKVDSLNNVISQSNPQPAISVIYTENQNSYNNMVLNNNCPENFAQICSATLPTKDFSQNLLCRQEKHFLKYYFMMNCVVGDSAQGYPDQNTVYGWLRPGWVEAHELAHNLRFR